MFKLLVVLVLVAVVSAKPGLLHGTTIATPVTVVTPTVFTPTAVSQQSRHDIINPGIITYTTAHIISAISVAPAVAAPAVGLPNAITSRVDIRRPAIAAPAAAPVPTGVVSSSGLRGGLAGGAGLGGVLGLAGHGY